tara:strand:- start:411 stop:614 length:204 start_codon:yes stop_codon:yes gene_type:complete
MIIPLIPQIKISRKKIARIKEKKAEIRPGDASMVNEILEKVAPVSGAGELSLQDFLILRKMVEGNIH